MGGGGGGSCCRADEMPAVLASLSAHSFPLTPALPWQQIRCSLYSRNWAGHTYVPVRAAHPTLFVCLLLFIRGGGVGGGGGVVLWVFLSTG